MVDGETVEREQRVPMSTSFVMQMGQIGGVRSYRIMIHGRSWTSV
jgi:hypothetical protein